MTHAPRGARGLGRQDDRPERRDGCEVSLTTLETGMREVRVQRLDVRDGEVAAMPPPQLAERHRRPEPFGRPLLARAERLHIGEQRRGRRVAYGSTDQDVGWRQVL